MLAKSQVEWSEIWPAFVAKAEARTGMNRAVPYIITDGQKINTSTAMTAFNTGRGIEVVTTAPHSQWQNPSERALQIVSDGPAQE